jgi:excisionase family DNA binding protein
MPNPQIGGSYLRTAEVADILHVAPKTVSRWAAEGKLPFLKTLGGHRRYPEDEIRELAAGLTVRLAGPYEGTKPPRTHEVSPRHRTGI